MLFSPPALPSRKRKWLMAKGFARERPTAGRETAGDEGRLKNELNTGRSEGRSSSQGFGVKLSHQTASLPNFALESLPLQRSRLAHSVPIVGSHNPIS